MPAKGDQKRNWTVNGTAQSAGGTFQKVTVRGESVVASDLNCELLKVMGTMQLDGNLRLQRGKVMGTLEVMGNLHGDDLSVLGELTVNGNLNAEHFTAKGSFQVDGMLNAGTLDVQLYGDSAAKEIGGTQIVVKPNGKWFGGGSRRLTVDTIEGDHVRLEHTTARVVRGNVVEIGPNCTIDVVEYQLDVSVDARATVKERVQR